MIGYSDSAKWRPDHTIATIFARENKVVFVERLCDYDELRWYGERHREILNRFIARVPREVLPNLTVLQPPPGFPASISVLSRFAGYEIMKLSLYSSRFFQAKWISSQLKTLGVSPTVLFISRPVDLPLIGRFGEKVACWYVYDELAIGAAGINQGPLIAEVETKHLSAVDIVFASSETQFRNRKNIHPNVHYVPNGVDFEHFGDSGKSNRAEPLDLARISRPRIGYIGGIDSRVDFDLVARIADTHPWWSIVFIGWLHKTADDRRADLSKHPNVHFLGTKSYKEMPAYVKGLDIGIIPWVVRPFTNAMLPMKMFDYLACGLPVVSTELNEVQPYSHMVGLAKDADEFGELIQQALHMNCPEKARNRIALAKENSWERRTALISGAIEERLQEDRAATG